MSLDSSLFYSVDFSDENRALSEDIASEAYRLAKVLDRLPEGECKELAFEKLKECAMWTNVALAQMELEEG